MVRTWEGKTKAFIKFGLKEAPCRDALRTTAALLTHVMYKRTSQKLAWSTAGVNFLVGVLLPERSGARGITDETIHHIPGSKEKNPL